MSIIENEFSSKVGIGVANKENIVGDGLGDNSVGPVDELDVNIKHTEASVMETDDLKKRPRSTVDDTVDRKPFGGDAVSSINTSVSTSFLSTGLADNNDLP
ncbi:hypothetical protein E1A91_A01G137800v1 [Gossypium mustelinum]|uniref:Uncharacterized protein n=2 Tax=Gossypium TaxID=3633 RepID=A0A5J5WZP8_GOSBA|nr:hypothetical protein ES319_A01G135300v1 [Gossypium barbadense]TYJ49497.1 hypothetical protein E1A91_A01G137800v1 [Gossypium mustelinum]